MSYLKLQKIKGKENIWKEDGDEGPKPVELEVNTHPLILSTSTQPCYIHSQDTRPISLTDKFTCKLGSTRTSAYIQSLSSSPPFCLQRKKNKDGYGGTNRCNGNKQKKSVVPEQDVCLHWFCIWGFLYFFFFSLPTLLSSHTQYLLKLFNSRIFHFLCFPEPVSFTSYSLKRNVLCNIEKAPRNSELNKIHCSMWLSARWILQNVSIGV